LRGAFFAAMDAYSPPRRFAPPRSRSRHILAPHARFSAVR
jgi:hypothetical protein